MALPYRPDIDGLRALAVLPVVLFHAKVPGFQGGFVGVDIFFVISGFLITAILIEDLRAGRFSLLRFYERRVRRILPALLLVAAVTTLTAIAFLVPPDLSDFARSLAGTLLFYANFVFAADVGYFDAPAETKPLLHSWSLAIEEQFYIVFPLLLWLLHRRVRSPFWPLAGLAALSFTAAVYATAEDAPRAFFMPHLRAWELLAGALIALAPWRAWPRKLAEPAGWAGLALLVAPVFLYSAETRFPGLAALPPVLGTALLIQAGRTAGLSAARFLAVPPLVGLGLISYALYLWHWPVLVFSQYAAIGPLAPAQTAGLLALSLFLAFASWRWIERPFRRPDRIARRPLFGMAGLVALALLAVAGVLDLTRGLPQRFPPQIVAMVEAKQAMRAAYADCTRRNRQLGTAPEAADTLAFACRIGAPDAAPDFLVWGDSHAGVLVHAVDRAAQKAGRAGWLLHHGGCPPLLDVTVARAHRSTACLRFNEGVARFLAAERPALVLLAARWALAETGVGFGLESELPMRLSLDGAEDRASVFREGLRRSLAAIRATDAEAVLIGPVPEIGFDPPARLAQAWRFGAGNPTGPTRAAFLTRQAGVFSSFDRLAAEHDATLIRPDSLLCPQIYCAIVHSGQTLYFDDDHLSLAGAALLAPLFDPVLRR
ncbi:MAG: acyltransferase family protein [Pseudomonadota bacterium]